MRDSMLKNGIKTTKDLLDYRSQFPMLHCNDGRNTDDIAPRLVMITSDITTQTKVQLPEMASLYWKDPDNEQPATYVRASMSIPVFFYPVMADDLPTLKLLPGRKIGSRGLIPKVAFVDGGLLNFPINVFIM
jgi:NTE family protein